MIKQTRVIIAAVTVIMVIMEVVIITGVSLLPRLNIEPPTANLFSSATLVQSVKPLGQLVSIRWQVAKAGILVDIRQGVGNVCHILGKSCRTRYGRGGHRLG